MSSNTVSNSGVYRAAVCTEIGKPLEIQTLPRVATLPNTQVRVKVDYSGVTFASILTVAGKYQTKSNPPFVPGFELCGHVIEVGNDVSHLKPGDHVIGFPSIGGAFAEEVVSEGLYYKIDKGLSSKEGAALTSSYGTAHMALTYTTHLKQGEVVLVTAAAGSLGLATVDLAANVLGAKVIGVCGGPDKCNLVKSYGADETIDYNCESIRERVKEITGGRGVDVAVDIVGGKVTEDCLRSLAFEGRLLTLGYASGEIPKIPANLLLLKSSSILGLFFGSYATNKPDVFHNSVTEVIRLWKEGKIRPNVGKVFTLPQVNEAFQFVMSRQSTGKVLLDCTKQSSL
jgi:NADPH2:quinone reductase